MVQRIFGTNETMLDESVLKVNEINPFEPTKTMRNAKVDPLRMQQLMHIIQS